MSIELLVIVIDVINFHLSYYYYYYYFYCDVDYFNYCLY